MRLALALLAAAAGCMPAPIARREGDPSLQEFVTRTNEYAELHRSMASGGADLGPTEDPREIAARKKELAERIHTARANAKQGDIFTRDSAEPLRRLIRRHAQQSPQQKSKPDVRLRVNASYPDSEPLPPMSPTLLASLPEVPEELEYRLIGTDLALLDSETRIVVDVLRNVRP